MLKLTVTFLVFRCVVYNEGSEKDMFLLYLTAVSDPESRKTFEYYYVTYRKAMFYAAYSVLGDTYEAEDAVHNAFLSISKHLDVLLNSAESDGKCYCVKAAKNAALNIVRKNNRSSGDVSIEELYNVPDEKSFEEIINQSEYSEVLDVIRNMDESYRDVLYMRYVMDMSVRQIADSLGRKVSTVKQQLVRGKKILIFRLSGEVMIADGK